MANGNGTDEHHDGRFDVIERGVKASVTLLFAAAVCYGFIFARDANGYTIVSADAFGAIAMGVILHWFRDRSDKEQTKNATAMLSAATPSLPAGTTMTLGEKP